MLGKKIVSIVLAFQSKLAKFSDENATYDSIYTYWSLVDSINEMLEDELKNELRLANQISIMMDETNDNQTVAQLCIFVRYWCKFRARVQVRFLKMVALPSKTHETLFNVCKDVMQEFNIPPEKVVGLGGRWSIDW
jgi:hypothetical protein